jgi:hypothetical protein
MTPTLKCIPRFQLSENRGLSRNIYIVDDEDRQIPEYELLCSAIDMDIVSAEGSGANALALASDIQAGKLEKVDLDGNSWVMHITREGVTFEDLFSFDDGGQVSLPLFMLAVATFISFISDPLKRPISVDFRI